MNKIYYIHGTMFSGKSLGLISTYSTYKFNGKNVLLLKPSTDTRDKGVIKSRMSNTEIPCILVDKEDDLVDTFCKEIRRSGKEVIPDVLMIDEVQFLTERQIRHLKYISEFCPVMCYGLKNSYTGELFPAIATLLALADDVKEVKTTCRCCNRKATHNLLVRDGKPIYDGAFENIEGENPLDEYIPVCRAHFYVPRLWEVE